MPDTRSGRGRPGRARASRPGCDRRSGRGSPGEWRSTPAATQQGGGGERAADVGVHVRAVGAKPRRRSVRAIRASEASPAMKPGTSAAPARWCGRAARPVVNGLSGSAVPPARAERVAQRLRHGASLTQHRVPDGHSKPSGCRNDVKCGVIATDRTATNWDLLSTALFAVFRGHAVDYRACRRVPAPPEAPDVAVSEEPLRPGRQRRWACATRRSAHRRRAAPAGDGPRRADDLRDADFCRMPPDGASTSSATTTGTPDGRADPGPGHPVRAGSGVHRGRVRAPYAMSDPRRGTRSACSTTSVSTAYVRCRWAA